MLSNTASSMTIICNKIKIIKKLKLLSLLLLLIFCTFSAVYLVKSNIDSMLLLILLGACILVSALIIIKMIKIRVFHFENTGEVFSIRYYHPLKKGLIFPVMEYPVNKLQTLKIESGLTSEILIVEILSRKTGKVVKAKLNVSDVERKDIWHLMNSFSKFSQLD